MGYEMVFDLPRKMKAVVNHAPYDFCLEEIPVPEVGPEEVLIRVGDAVSALEM